MKFYPGRDYLSENKKGILALFLSYFWWGSTPAYWKALENISSSEILGHRVVWSALTILALIIAQGHWRAVARFIRYEREKVVYLAAGGFLITLNWGIFIWAINHGRILECSLGYFINPLVSILFGVVFFKEKLNKYQIAALMLATAGIVVELIAVNSIPIVSISLALTFGLYGVLKKAIPITPATGLFIETLTVTPFALAWLFFVQKSGVAAFPYNAATNILLAGTGIMTCIPLILFAYGAKRVQLTTLGFVQYISPTITFFIGTLVYNEPLHLSRICTFAFIWTALVIYTADAVARSKEGAGIL